MHLSGNIRSISQGRLRRRREKGIGGGGGGGVGGSVGGSDRCAAWCERGEVCRLSISTCLCPLGGKCMPSSTENRVQINLSILQVWRENRSVFASERARII